MTLATWEGFIGRNILIQDVKCTCYPMFESVSDGVRPKEAHFNSLPLTYNGEVAKLTWPWVTDIKIPRYAFYGYCYVYQSLKVSRWSASRCNGSYDEHSNFFRVEVTWRNLVTWPWVIWVWNLHMCGQDVWTGVSKNGGTEDAEGEGCPNTQPAWRRLGRHPVMPAYLCLWLNKYFFYMWAWPAAENSYKVLTFIKTWTKIL